MREEYYKIMFGIISFIKMKNLIQLIEHIHTDIIGKFNTNITRTILVDF